MHYYYYFLFSIIRGCVLFIIFLKQNKCNYLTALTIFSSLCSLLKIENNLSPFYRIFSERLHFSLFLIPTIWRHSFLAYFNFSNKLLFILLLKEPVVCWHDINSHGNITDRDVSQYWKIEQQEEGRIFG